MDGDQSPALLFGSGFFSWLPEAVAPKRIQMNQVAAGFCIFSANMLS